MKITHAISNPEKITVKIKLLPGARLTAQERTDTSAIRYNPAK